MAQREGLANDEMIDLLSEAHDKHMKRKEDDYSKEVWRRVEKSILLQQVDKHWKDHLLSMDHMRQGITLRALGQRDPLNEYKTEAFGMFQTMLIMLKQTTVQMLSMIEIDPEAGTLSYGDLAEANTDVHEGRTDPALENNQQSQGQDPYPQDKAQPFRHDNTMPFNKNDSSTWGKVSRNAACPCDSGKKFKHCHGKIAANG